MIGKITHNQYRLVYIRLHTPDYTKVSPADIKG